MVQERIDPWYPIRINTIFVFILIGIIGLGVRMYILQIRHHQFYLEKAKKQQIIKMVIPARRGSVYDVNGMSLASTEKAQTICLVPARLNKKVDSIHMLSNLFNMDPDIIRRRVASGKHLVYIKRKVTDQYAARIEALNIPGITFESEDRRNYPNLKLASHLIGFTGVDNNGMEGIELYYDDILTGRDGYQEINRNALSAGGAFIDANRRFRAQVDGSDIYLTIDGFVQGVTEEVLKGIQEEYEPDAISAVVVDPRNGRILAMANTPDFVPSLYNKFSAEMRKNRAITDVFEPGSVMKVFTAAAAINEGIDPVEEMFDCENGVFYYKGRTLHDHDPYGTMNLTDIIVHSSNIGVGKIGILLGSDTLRRYFAEFGFGTKTGIKFPGEQSGYLRPAASWNAFTLTSVTMGHEITCNALQVVMAMSAVANGGLLYKPQLVDRIVEANGRVLHAADTETVRRVISRETSDHLRLILEKVVEEGTARKAQINGIRVGGKTGTAQLLVTDKITGKKMYSDTAYMASFCGFAPIEDPRICLIISVRNPKGSNYYGGSVAAPGVREIIQRTLKYLSAPITTYRGQQ